MSQMSDWHGIPRKEIDWCPTIDYDKCKDCMACVKFCNHGVYENQNNKSVVAKPENCIVGCSGCDAICPNGAISHPTKEYLTKLEKKYLNKD
jgi:NAD-dependent dihydropyrimidine dehydrogenase PreA subunit